MTLLNKQLIKGLLFIAILIAIGAVFKLSMFNDSLSPESIKNILGPNFYTAIAIYIVIGAVATMLGLPRQSVAFIAGYYFGFSTGLVISTIAATLGCIFCFYISRYFSHEYIQRKHPKKITYINQFMENDVFVKTLIIRLLPIGSNLVTNLVAGVAKIRARDFFTGSAVGYIPQMAIFSLTGSGISVESTSQVIISVCLFVLCIILGGWLYKKHRQTNLIVSNG